MYHSVFESSSLLHEIFQNEYAHRWKEYILVDDDRKFLYCAVAKTGSTNMKWSLIETSSRISKEEINKSQNIVGKQVQLKRYKNLGIYIEVLFNC